MQDPYQVLGVSPQSTDDEIKKAYRALAKKYHPDVNNGSAAAEARMKEVNEAYSAVMKMRREGGSTGYGGATSGTGYGRGSGYGSYGAYSGYSGYSSSYGGYGSGAYRTASSPRMQAVRNYIQSGRYHEAMHLLEEINERNAEWYYLCGEVNLGLGNRVAALNFARQAVNMDPNSFEYRALLSRLENASSFYQANGTQRGFTMPGFVCGNPLLSCCAINLLCNLLCNCCGGGRGFYGGC